MILTEPEDLKKAALGPYETIGMLVAKDCREETDTTWGHGLLRHNADEIGGLRVRRSANVVPVLKMRRSAQTPSPLS